MDQLDSKSAVMDNTFSTVLKQLVQFSEKAYVNKCILLSGPARSGKTCFRSFLCGRSLVHTFNDNTGVYEQILESPQKEADWTDNLDETSSNRISWTLRDTNLICELPAFSALDDYHRIGYCAICNYLLHRFACHIVVFIPLYAYDNAEMIKKSFVSVLQTLVSEKAIFYADGRIEDYVSVCLSKLEEENSVYVFVEQLENMETDYDYEEKCAKTMFESVLKKRQVYEFFNRELKPEDGGKFFARLAYSQYFKLPKYGVTVASEKVVGELNYLAADYLATITNLIQVRFEVLFEAIRIFYSFGKDKGSQKFIELRQLTEKLSRWKPITSVLSIVHASDFPYNALQNILNIVSQLLKEIDEETFRLYSYRLLYAIKQSGAYIIKDNIFQTLCSFLLYNTMIWYFSRVFVSLNFFKQLNYMKKVLLKEDENEYLLIDNEIDVYDINISSASNHSSSVNRQNYVQLKEEYRGSSISKVFNLPPNHFKLDVLLYWVKIDWLEAAPDKKIDYFVLRFVLKQVAHILYLYRMPIQSILILSIIPDYNAIYELIEELFKQEFKQEKFFGRVISVKGEKVLYYVFDLCCLTKRHELAKQISFLLYANVADLPAYKRRQLRISLEENITKAPKQTDLLAVFYNKRSSSLNSFLQEKNIYVKYCKKYEESKYYSYVESLEYLFKGPQRYLVLN